MFARLKFTPDRLLAALPVAVMSFMLSLVNPMASFAVTAAATPTGGLPSGVKPTYDSPANGPVVKLINTGLGICILVLLFFVVVGIVQWVQSIGNMREGGLGHPLVKSGAAILGIGIILSLNTFVTGWSNFVLT